MDKLFIIAKANYSIKIPKDYIDSNKKNKIALITTIQYLHIVDNIVRDNDNFLLGGQILGCRGEEAINLKDKINHYLYIGSGRFHPLNIAYKTNKRVDCYNPQTKELTTITKEEILKFTQKLKGLYLRFLSSKNIGIMISTKPGQNNLKKALDFKTRFEHEKTFYFFLADTFFPSDLENYKEIDLFINTACPRIIEDYYPKPVLSLDYLEEILLKK
jgi:2-(3-amino-3-carboxypropyl)histidine synthase